MWTVLYGILLLITYSFIMPCYFSAEDKKRFLSALHIKMIPPITAAALTAVNQIVFPQNNSLFPWMIVAAVLMGGLADGALNINFVFGGILFLLGHFIYLTAVLILGGFCWLQLISSLAVWIVLVLYLTIFKKNGLVGISFGLGVLYSVALSMFVGFSTTLVFYEFSFRTLMLAIGSVLFCISDITMCYNRYRKCGRLSNFVSLAIYYTAQIVLSLSAVIMDL